ncbi:MAG: M48 family metallopeptidase, partial [Gammaproteobacteria bacterium]
MDFFARQEQSRRTTRYLVLLFALAFLSVALATAIVVAALFQFLPAFDQPLLSTTIGDGTRSVLIPFLATIGIVLLLMVIASAGRSATLSRGGASVARMLGGTEIHGDSKDPLHRRLVNVVEEMSIAAGVPVPDIFVLESESGINAFAAGLEHSDAAVAVTRGALERLNRAELQGVIAHEFSHILNGDMRINQRLIGFSFGILVLALAGRWMLRSMRFTRRSRSDKGSIALILGIALAVIGSIGVFFSRLIKAAVSRQREMLADASAVQFTREPDGLAGALKKIGGYSSDFTAAEAEEVAHMLFGRGSRAFRGWFATHPPILDRIRALDPSFTEDDFVRLPDQAQTPSDDSESMHTQHLAPASAAAQISVDD